MEVNAAGRACEVAAECDDGIAFADDCDGVSIERAVSDAVHGVDGDLAVEGGGESGCPMRIGIFSDALAGAEADLPFEVERGLADVCFVSVGDFVRGLGDIRWIHDRFEVGAGARIVGEGVFGEVLNQSVEGMGFWEGHEGILGVRVGQGMREARFGMGAFSGGIGVVWGRRRRGRLRLNVTYSCGEVASGIACEIC